MSSTIFENISLRRRRIAGLLLSEKALQKKDLLALNLELYAASQAVHSAQRCLIVEEIQQLRKEVNAGKKKQALTRLATLEKLLRQ